MPAEEIVVGTRVDHRLVALRMEHRPVERRAHIVPATEWVSPDWVLRIDLVFEYWVPTVVGTEVDGVDCRAVHTARASCWRLAARS